MQGGFFFHPSDEDLSLGTPDMKKPLECVLSVYTNSETAIVLLLEAIGLLAALPPQGEQR